MGLDMLRRDLTQGAPSLSMGGMYSEGSLSMAARPNYQQQQHHHLQQQHHQHQQLQQQHHQQQQQQQQHGSQSLQAQLGGRVLLSNAGGSMGQGQGQVGAPPLCRCRTHTRLCAQCSLLDDAQLAKGTAMQPSVAYECIP